MAPPCPCLDEISSVLICRMPDEKQVIALVRRAGNANNFRVRRGAHVKQRQDERDILSTDLRSAMAGATRCKPTHQDRWEVGGPSVDGPEITLILAVDVPMFSIFAVTVYWSR